MQILPQTSQARQKLLIIGGGAVGQVYGWALAKSGADVSFFLKKEHADSARAGFTLFWLNRDPSRSHPLKLTPFSILTEPQAISETLWDQIFITVSSNALRAGWIEEFASRVPPSSQVITLQPGIHDLEYLKRFFTPSQLRSQVIPFIAFEADGATAFYLPPFTFSPLGRDLSASQRKRVAFYSAFLIMFVVALELADWSLRTLCEQSRLMALHRSIRECNEVVSKQVGTGIPLPLRLITPSLLKLAIRIAPRLFPFDLEKYLKAHFTKVREQTRQMTQEYREISQRFDLPFSL